MMRDHGAWIFGAAGLFAGLTPATAAADPLTTGPHGNALGDNLKLYEPPSEPVEIQVCAGPETLQGIDVSYYQGDIDWNAVAADGITFAWVRVSHSTQFFDPQFDANLAGARAAGIHVGVYQYFEPGQDPLAQANFLLDHMGPLQPGDMPPMIDVESADSVAPAAYADAIRVWLDRVEEVTGVPPIIYTGYYYWNDNVGSDEFIDHPLWMANYNPGCPLIPDYWVTWTFHQYCACESIAGISGDVDGDTFNGNLDDLLALSVGSGVCGDGTCAFGEDEFSCAQDCPPCGVIPPAGGTIDNGEECYELYGPAEYWREEAAGQGGSLVWTNATDFDEPSNYAIWRLYFEESGLYSVEAHIEQPFGETMQASYQISHAGGETLAPVNQSSEGGWVSLGDLEFTAATNHWVRLDDDTGESVDLEVSIVYDALRVTRLDGGPDPDPDTGLDTGLDTGGGGTSSPGTGSASEGGPFDSSGGGSAADDTFALPEARGDDVQGCGCRGTGGAGYGWWLLLPLMGLARKRRTGKQPSARG